MWVVQNGGCRWSSIGSRLAPSLSSVDVICHRQPASRIRASRYSAHYVSRVHRVTPWPPCLFVPRPHDVYCAHCLHIYVPVDNPQLRHRMRPEAYAYGVGGLQFGCAPYHITSRGNTYCIVCGANKSRITGMRATRRKHDLLSIVLNRGSVKTQLSGSKDFSAQLQPGMKD